jgi:hypothetical protein
MFRHDKLDALRRWCSNWCHDPDFRLHEDYWITIDENVFYTRRGKRCVRYLGKVGWGDKDYFATVRFEAGAPPPPVFHWAPRVPPRPERPVPRMTATQVEEFKRSMDTVTFVQLVPQRYVDITTMGMQDIQQLPEIRILSVEESAQLAIGADLDKLAAQHGLRRPQWNDGDGWRAETDANLRARLLEKVKETALQPNWQKALLRLVRAADLPPAPLLEEDQTKRWEPTPDPTPRPAHYQSPKPRRNS